MKPKLQLSGPPGKSLEEYKAWMTEIFEKLGAADDEGEMTEEAWEEDWKAFWADEEKLRG